jgi:undecaprenyl-diphosphatase
LYFYADILLTLPCMKTISQICPGFIISMLLLITQNAHAQFAPVQQFDDRVLIDLSHHRTPEQTGIFLFLSNTYRYGDIGVPAGLFIAGVANHDMAMRQNSLFVASSTFVSYGLMAVIKAVVKRPRPFIQNVNIVPVYRAGSYSFPSGHAASTIATATALSMAYPKWYVIAPAFLWAGSVSYSRMYLGVHYPSDVAAGTLLGAGSALSLSFLKK